MSVSGTTFEHPLNVEKSHIIRIRQYNRAQRGNLTGNSGHPLTWNTRGSRTAANEWAVSSQLPLSVSLCEWTSSSRSSDCHQTSCRIIFRILSSWTCTVLPIGNAAAALLIWGDPVISGVLLVGEMQIIVDLSHPNYTQKKAFSSQVWLLFINS